MEWENRRSSVCAWPGVSEAACSCPHNPLRVPQSQTVPLPFCPTATYYGTVRMDVHDQMGKRPTTGKYPGGQSYIAIVLR